MKTHIFLGSFLLELFRPLAITLFICLFMACQPEEPSQWYKGNLHTHSYWSDGDDFPEMIMDWYQKADYDFVVLSEHNILAEGEKWTRIADQNQVLREGFTRYLSRFGEEWVVQEPDSAGIRVRLKTLEEYAPLFNIADSFLILPAEEITTSLDKHPIHINATNIQELILPLEGASVAETMQANIDAVLQQRAETGVPIMPHINHPNFGYGVSVDDLIALRGERFFEVYNGHPLVHNYGDSLHISTEQMWDQINQAYFDRGQALMYGLATDDAHNYHLFGDAYSNAGRGWVMVKAPSLDATSLIGALEAGDFYASTGVQLLEVYFADNRLQVSVVAEPNVAYEIQFIGMTKLDAEARVLAQVNGTEAMFQLTEDLRFVRAKIISNVKQDNPFQEGDFEVAWTQPVVWR